MDLRRDGSDYNMPTQRAMNLGLFKMKETAITHSDGHVTKNRESYGKRSAVFCELFFIKGNKGENQ